MVNRNSNYLENGIRVKISKMQNAIARIASTRAQIKFTVEQAKKDISDTIDHQLLHIRAREMELFKKIEINFEKKEGILADQHDQIVQSIGALQHALCCLSQNKIDSSTVQDLLMRFNAINLRPKESLGILFDYDSNNIRNVIMNFGNILEAEDCANTNSTTIPIGEVEMYDEDLNVLSHKSVFRLYPPTVTSKKAESAKSFKSSGEGFNFWLSQVKEQLKIKDEYSLDKRSRLESFSSFEIMKSASIKDESSITTLSSNITDETVETNNRSIAEYFSKMPYDYWLNKPKNNLQFDTNTIMTTDKDSCFSPTFDTNFTTDEQVFVESKNTNFTKFSPFTTPFNQSEWLIKPKNECNDGYQTKLKEFPVYNFPYGGAMSIKDNQFWLKDLPKKNKDRPMNEMPKDLSSWESVLGWKSILEKIHASGEDCWLSPASRVIKNVVEKDDCEIVREKKPKLEGSIKDNLTCYSQNKQHRMLSGMALLLQGFKTSSKTKSCDDSEIPFPKQNVEVCNFKVNEKKADEPASSMQLKRIIRPDVVFADALAYHSVKPKQSITDCFQHTASTFSFLPKIQTNNYVRSCQWSRNGRFLATDSQDRVVRLFSYNLDDVQLLERTKIPFGGLVYELKWHPTEELIASTSKEQPVHIWDIDGKLRASFRGINASDELSSAYSLTFSIDGKNLIGGYRNYIRVFDVNRPGKQVSEIKTFDKRNIMFGGQKGIISVLTSSPMLCGTYAASSFCGTVGLYSSDQIGCHCFFSTGRSGITHAQYSSDGQRLFVGYRKYGLIHCYDLRNPGNLFASYARPAETNQRIYFEVDPHNRYLYSGTSCGHIFVHQLNDHQHEPLIKFRASVSAVSGLSLHPENCLVFAVTTGQRVFPLPLSDGDCSDSAPSSLKSSQAYETVEYEYNADQSMIDNSLKLYNLPDPINPNEYNDPNRTNDS